MWRYLQSKRQSIRYFKYEQNKKNYLLSKNQQKISDYFTIIKVFLKFPNNFTFSILVPVCLSVQQLFQLVRSYIKLHQRYAPDGYEFVGLEKNIQQIDVKNSNSHKIHEGQSNLQKMVDFMLQSSMIMMNKIKLQDFRKNQLKFDVKYGKICNNKYNNSVNSQLKVKSKSISQQQEVRSNLHQKWLGENRFQIVEYQLFCEINEYNIQSIQDQLILIPIKSFNHSSPFHNQNNTLRNQSTILFSPHHIIQSFDEIQRLLNLKQLFSADSQYFSELLQVSYKTQCGFVMIFQNKVKISLMEYLKKYQQFKQTDFNRNTHQIERGINVYYQQIVKIVRYVFNSTKDQHIMLKKLIVRLVEDDTVIEMFCFIIQDGLEEVKINTKFVIKNLINININYDKNYNNKSTDKNDKQLVIQYLNNKFKSLISSKDINNNNNEYITLSNQYQFYDFTEPKYRQFKQPHINLSIYHHLHQHLESFLTQILQQHSILQLRSKCQQIASKFYKILSTQKYTKCQQFQFQREQSKLYKNDVSIDINEKSTVKKYKNQIKYNRNSIVQNNNKKNTIIQNNNNKSVNKSTKKSRKNEIKENNQKKIKKNMIISQFMLDDNKKKNIKNMKIKK